MLSSAQNPPKMGVPRRRLVDFPSGRLSPSSVYMRSDPNPALLGGCLPSTSLKPRPTHSQLRVHSNMLCTQQAPIKTSSVLSVCQEGFGYSSLALLHGPEAQESPGEEQSQYTQGPFRNFLSKNHFMPPPSQFPLCSPSFRITFTGLMSGQSLYNFKVIVWGFPVGTRV